MFEKERHLFPEPFANAHGWLDKNGQAAWEVLCDVTPTDEWFKSRDYALEFQVEMRTLGIMKSYSPSTIRAQTLMEYLLKLARYQKEAHPELDQVILCRSGQWGTREWFWTVQADDLKPLNGEST